MSVDDNICRQGIVHPFNCQPVETCLSISETISRLKKLFTSLKCVNKNNVKKQKSNFVLYESLALHLCSEHFMNHCDQMVQVLTICCLLEILQHITHEKLNIYELLVSTVIKLEGLKKEDTFIVKYFSFMIECLYERNLELELVKDQRRCFYDICFMKMFDVLDFTSKSVAHRIAQLLSKYMDDILAEGIDPEPVLNIIFKRLLDPDCHNCPIGYGLANKLLMEKKHKLEPWAKMALIHRLNHGPDVDSTRIIDLRVFDIIYLLYNIDPLMMLGVINTLECPLYSKNEKEKHEATEFLCKLFSENGSTTGQNYSKLWKSFLDSLCGDDSAVHDIIIKYTKLFLINQPLLRSSFVDVVSYLGNSRSVVNRMNIMEKIFEAIMVDESLLTDECNVLNVLVMRRRDQNLEIRSKAIIYLGNISKKYIFTSCEMSREKIIYIQNEIFGNYYESFATTSDRLAVKYCISKLLVPTSLPNEKRMKCYLNFWFNLNVNSQKAFHTMNEGIWRVRKNTEDLVKYLSNESNMQCENVKHILLHISEDLIDPEKAYKDLLAIIQGLENKSNFISLFKIIIDPLSTHTVRNTAQYSILSLIKKDVKTSSKSLMQSFKSWLAYFTFFNIDISSFEVLVKTIKKMHKSTKEYNKLKHEKISMPSLKFLYEIIHGEPHLGYQGYLIELLTEFLEEKTLVYMVLKIFRSIARYKPIGGNYESLYEEKLASMWYWFATKGEIKVSKLAMECILLHIAANEEFLYNKVLCNIKAKLNVTYGVRFVNSVRMLGAFAKLHSSQVDPQLFCEVIAAAKLEELILSKSEPEIEDRRCSDMYKLPLNTLCKVIAIKTLTKYYMSPVCNEQIVCYFEVLKYIILNEGKATSKHDRSESEHLWLKTSSGCAILQLISRISFWESLPMEMFVCLGDFIIDEDEQAYSAFLKELSYQLIENNESIPTDLFALFVFSGIIHDKDKKKSLESIFYNAVRSKWIRINRIQRTLTEPSEFVNYLKKHQDILPEYCIGAAIALLAYHERFKSIKNMLVKKDVVMCLKFLFKILLTHQFTDARPNVQYYIDVIQFMRQNSTKQNKKLNERMQLVCDIALSCIDQKKVLKDGYRVRRIQFPTKYV